MPECYRKITLNLLCKKRRLRNNLQLHFSHHILVLSSIVSIMKQSKLIKLLKSIPSKDLNRLQTFVRSPYFNTNDNLMELLDYLLLFAPKFQSDSLTIHGAYIYIFKDNKSIDSDETSVITKLNSKLLSLILRFMENEAFGQSPIDRLFFRYKWVSKYGLLDVKASILNDLRECFEKLEYKDLEYAYNTYRLEAAQAQHVVFKQLVTDKLRLDKLNQSLDEYYLQAKYEILCHLANHAILSRQEYKLDEIKGISIIYDARKSKLNNLTNIWKKSFQMLTEPSTKSHYVELREYFLDVRETISPTDCRVVFHFLSNCSRYAFTDTALYNKEMFSLYSLQISSNVLRFNGTIQPETLYNVISIAIVNREYKWAEVFYEEYKKWVNLSNDKAEDMIALCSAMLAFETGAYNSALECINQTKFRDIQCKLTEKRIRLKLYAELSMNSLLEDHINAFRKFLTINLQHIAPHHLEGCRNFINLASALIDIQYKSKKDKEILSKKIKETPILPERNWLDKKLTQAVLE